MYCLKVSSQLLRLRKVVLLLQKMSEWVAVCADEAEEPVEIPTEADGESFPLFAISTFAEIPFDTLFAVQARCCSHQ